MLCNDPFFGFKKVLWREGIPIFLVFYFFFLLIKILYKNTNLSHIFKKLLKILKIYSKNILISKYLY